MYNKPLNETLRHRIFFNAATSAELLEQVFVVLRRVRSDGIWRQTHDSGAHLLGPGVDEVINVFALSIRQGIKAKELRDAMFAYPSGASDIGHMLA